MTMSQRMWKREQERRRRERMRRAKRRRNCAIAVVLFAIIAVVSIIIANTGNDKKEANTDVTTTPATVTADEKAVTDPYTTTREISEIKKSFYADSAFAGNALAHTVGMYGILEETDFYASVNADLENVYTLTTEGSTTSISEQFKSKRFSKVFLSFGENELKRLTASEFKNHYKKLVEKLEEYQPNARIYLIGIPPVTASASNSGDGKITIQKIKEFNKRIMSVAVDNELYYIDSIDALGDNKDFLPKGVSADGVNLNKAAVVDLLYYASKKAYIPDLNDFSDLDIEEDEEDEEDEEPVKEDVSAPLPSPTVNVFKDSVSNRKSESD